LKNQAIHGINDVIGTYGALGETEMSKASTIDYSVLDRPDVLMHLFHPRKEWGNPDGEKPGKEVLIDVEQGVAVGARFHMVDKIGASILFFHGNGEIVSDYDDLGPLYNQLGINFLAVDYRGYGRSNGEPSVSAMMQDCHTIFKYTKIWLEDHGYNGPLIVMGRSLGSASALELVASHGDDIDALIIESGFTLAEPLLKLLGIDTQTLGFREKSGFRNIDKIAGFKKPTLIIHAAYDHIIPFSNGESLFNASETDDKQLLKIPDANHNDIFMRGLSEYLKAIRDLIDRLTT